MRFINNMTDFESGRFVAIWNKQSLHCEPMIALVSSHNRYLCTLSGISYNASEQLLRQVNMADYLIWQFEAGDGYSMIEPVEIAEYLSMKILAKTNRKNTLGWWTFAKVRTVQGDMLSQLSHYNSDSRGNIGFFFSGNVEV